MEIIIAKLASVPLSPFLALFSLIGLAAGISMALNPVLSIEMQRRFYYRINWKIEPVSLPKEIRNTRAMGWLLIAISAGTLLFLIVK